jgi:hypothetical protein
MNRIDYRLVLGSLLIIAGVMALLQNLNILPDGIDWFWGLLFAAGGLGFIYTWATAQQKNWWAIIPGLVLLAIGVLNFLPNSLEKIGGAIFLGSIGLAFFISYFTDHGRWWAIIPGGVLSTLAVVSALPEMMQGIETGGFFFLGLALTFLLVAVLPNPTKSTNWAYIPALVLFIFGAGLMAFSAASTVATLIGPAALLIVGAFLIMRAFRKE